MSIETYDYVKIPGIKCRDCGTGEDIVQDGDGFICSDCLFELRCQQYEDKDGPPSPWVFSSNEDKEDGSA